MLVKIADLIEQYHVKDNAIVSWSPPDEDFNCINGYEVTWKWEDGEGSILLNFLWS
jgi:hypothetical protein